MRALGLCLICVWFCSATEVQAQTTKDFQIWTAVFANGPVTTKTGLNYWFDAHARRGDTGSVLILRPGLGYAFRPWGSVWVGYAWAPVFSDGGARADVQGIWEQLTFTKAKAPHLLLQSRTRFEQFWINTADGMYPRLRQFVRANYRPGERFPVGVAFFDEVFFGLKSVSWGKAGFFENRLFAGLAIFAVERIFRVEAGYLLINRDPSASTQLIHALAINFFISVGAGTREQSSR